MITTQERLELVVSVVIPHGSTVSDTVDWLSRFFDYYHPKLEARVTTKHPVVHKEDVDVPVPGEELL
jgi:hypothetical protein